MSELPGTPARHPVAGGAVWAPFLLPEATVPPHTDTAPVRLVGPRVGCSFAHLDVL